MTEQEIGEIVWDGIQSYLNKCVSFNNEDSRDEVENILYGVEDAIAITLRQKFDDELNRQKNYPYFSDKKERK